MKQKHIFKIVSIILLLSLSTFTYFSLDRVKKDYVAPNIIENEHMKSLLEQYITDSIILIDYTLNPEKYTYKDEYKEKYQIDKNTFENSLININSNKGYLDGDPNFSYAAIDVASGRKLNDINSINTKDMLIIKINIDDKGNLDFINGKTFNVEQYLIDGSYNALFSTNELRPKNLEITMAIPKVLVSHEGAIYQFQQYSFETYFMDQILIYGCIIIGIIALFALFYPIKIMKECQPFQTIKKIKLEIVTALMSFSLFFTIVILLETLQNDFSDLVKLSMGKELMMSISILLGVLFLTLIMSFIFLMKYIFYKGIVNYIKENTVLFWIITRFELIFHLDFKRNPLKLVIKVVGVNFIIILLCLYFYEVSPIIALIYCVALGVCLYKYLNKIIADYNILYASTKQLSAGKLDVDINQNIGIFEPLKGAIIGIKQGFKKAVIEETKSTMMKTELISNVSHDLKTPLTSLITYIDLLKEDKITNEDREKYLEILDHNALRLKNLIDDLFEVSKVNSGDITLDCIEVDIISLLKQGLFELENKLEQKHLNIIINCDDDKILCNLDSKKTYRIIENLLVNIATHTMENTRVYIDIIKHEDTCEIIMKNISSEPMNFSADEIVERFVQGDPSRNKNGSGLGLAIAKSFTEIQDGKFTITIDGDLFKVAIEFKTIK